MSGVTNLGMQRAAATQKIQGVQGVNMVGKPVAKPGAVKAPMVHTPQPAQTTSSVETVKQENTAPTNPGVKKSTPFATISQQELEKQALNVAMKLAAITNEMKQLFVERDDIIESMMTALIAGQHVLLLGPPGTGKSALSLEFFKRISNSKYFSHLLNRTSDPSEIVGPISIKAMERDKFVRIFDGKLGDCDIAFIDEIYKSNEPTLNIMLSALNERVIYNDGKPVPIPLKMMVAASNEMPAEGEGLEALHDRILVKHMVEYIKDPNNRLVMMKNYNDAKNPYSLQNIQRTTITIEELELIQYYKNAVALTKGAMSSYNKVLNSLANKKITVSDRKVNWCLDIMKGSALLHCRTQVCEDDIKALIPVLWERVEDIPVITQEINKLVDPFSEKINEWYTEAMSMINDINALNTKGDAESKTKSYELTIEGKTKTDVIIKKMNDTIAEMSKKGKDITKASTLRDKVSGDITAIVSKILNIPASSMVQQQQPIQAGFSSSPAGIDAFMDAPF